MDQKKAENKELPRIAAFLLIQASVVLTAAGVVYGRLETHQTQPPLPQLRATPLSIAPTYDRPEIVDDVQLYSVLYKLRPRFAGPHPKINHVDHALRCWGTNAQFDDPECLSGVQMRDLLLDHRNFARAWGKDEPPLLMADRLGVAVRTKEGHASASHIDHTLACLAESGTTLRFPVYLPQGQTTLASLLARSLRTFSVNQSEYEWSMTAFVQYLDSPAPWKTSEGQEVNFDRLAQRIMREELRCGVCCGQHRLSNLVLFLRIDEKRRILSPECRNKILEHLGGASKLLVRSQHAKGYWTREWWTGSPPKPEEDNRSGSISPEQWRLLATSHVLEWLALAPENVHPPIETLAKAGRWLTETVLQMDEKQVCQEGYYPPMSHVCMALALWRGRFPSQVLADKGLREQAHGMKSAASH